MWIGNVVTAFRARGLRAPEPNRGLAWPGFPSVYRTLVMAEFDELSRRAWKRTRPRR